MKSSPCFTKEISLQVLLKMPQLITSGGSGLLMLGTHHAGELDDAAGKDKEGGSPRSYLFR